MPIYEYRCEACGHYMDALQKISDAPLTDCPGCSKVSLKRLISAPSFRLKGSGWYETDFKSDKDRKRNLVDSGNKPTESGGAESKPEQKSDAKTETKSETKSDARKPAVESGSKSGKKGSGSEAA